MYAVDDHRRMRISGELPRCKIPSHDAAQGSCCCADYLIVWSCS